MIEGTGYASFENNYLWIIAVSLDMGIVNIFVFHAIWAHLQPDFNTDIQALRKLFWQEGHHPPLPRTKSKGAFTCMPS